MGVLPGLVDQPGEHRPGDPLQRHLPGVGRTQLVRGHAEPVAALFGEVAHEAVLDQHGQQAVGGRPGRVERDGERGRRQRPGLRDSSVRMASVWSAAGASDTHQCLVYETLSLGTLCARRAKRGVMNHEEHDPGGRRRRRTAPSERTSSPSHGTGPASGLRRGPRRDPPQPRGRRRARRRHRPTTASRPASARWPPCRSRRSATLQRSLVRSHAASTGPEVEREVVRALMLLRLSTLATGRTGVRPRPLARTPPCSTPASRRSSASTAPGLLRRPGAAGPLRAGADGRGRGPRRRGALRPVASPSPPTSPRTPDREGGPRAHQRDRRHARHAGAGAARPRTLLNTADVAAAMSVESLLGTDAVFAADLQGLRPHPGQARPRRTSARSCGRLRDHGQPPDRRRAPACRTRTRCAAPRRCTVRRATPWRTPRPSPSASCPPRSTTR